MSKPRREYDVYLESELSLGIACGELMVPPNAEVFKVREVFEGDTEAADEIERLLQENEQLREENKRMRYLLDGVVDDMVVGKDWEHLLMSIERELNDE